MKIIEKRFDYYSYFTDPDCDVWESEIGITCNVELMSVLRNLEIPAYTTTLWLSLHTSSANNRIPLTLVEVDTWHMVIVLNGMSYDFAMDIPELQPWIGKTLYLEVAYEC